MNQLLEIERSNEELAKSLNFLKFEDFLENWDRAYEDEVKKIKLFSEEHNRCLNQEQKAYFLKVFYQLSKGIYRDGFMEKDSDFIEKQQSFANSY